MAPPRGPASSSDCEQLMLAIVVRKPSRRHRGVASVRRGQNSTYFFLTTSMRATVHTASCR